MRIFCNTTSPAETSAKRLLCAPPQHLHVVHNFQRHKEDARCMVQRVYFSACLLFKHSPARAVVQINSYERTDASSKHRPSEIYSTVFAVPTTPPQYHPPMSQCAVQTDLQVTELCVSIVVLHVLSSRMTSSLK